MNIFFLTATKKLNINEEQLLWCANIMRVHGVRIKNSEKNVGKPKVRDVNRF